MFFCSSSITFASLLTPSDLSFSSLLLWFRSHVSSHLETVHRIHLLFPQLVSLSYLVLMCEWDSFFFSRDGWEGGKEIDDRDRNNSLSSNPSSFSLLGRSDWTRGLSHSFFWHRYANESSFFPVGASLSSFSFIANHLNLSLLSLYMNSSRSASTVFPLSFSVPPSILSTSLSCLHTIVFRPPE